MLGLATVASIQQCSYVQGLDGKKIASIRLLHRARPEESVVCGDDWFVLVLSEAVLVLDLVVAASKQFRSIANAATALRIPLEARKVNRRGHGEHRERRANASEDSVLSVVQSRAHHPTIESSEAID